MPTTFLLASGVSTLALALPKIWAVSAAAGAALNASAAAEASNNFFIEGPLAVTTGENGSTLQ
ncbi:exported hypothetical protein [Bosea sp. 62]|nr:exported hypothetical protein [Bosea sp. 7B]CAD5297149.1 exported hypothetical protein [Bosea sp. 21B]VVT61245.1 exported hypothetical protein [Bosea sp. EC-HK365B]VXB21224.1 exported hypothetical protein [Bosea sp. 125]VXB23109.1 exported hypothetical protein [Bosea sp. 127]VXC80953.1 exported hypothetical protein [Bosea sp. 29B]VXC85686.1 exported hypothetical protein [Bosea sp. 62]